MKFYLVLIPVIVLALFQAVFLPLNLVLAVVLLWAALKKGREVYLMAFFGGVVLDLALGQTLGISSLLFLVFSFLIQLYSRRFEVVNPLVLAGFVFLFSLAGNLVWGSLRLGESFWLAGLSFLAAPWLKRLKRESEGLKLGVP